MRGTFQKAVVIHAEECFRLKVGFVHVFWRENSNKNFVGDVGDVAEEDLIKPRPNYAGLAAHVRSKVEATSLRSAPRDELHCSCECCRRASCAT